MNEFIEQIRLFEGDLRKISSLIHANPETAYQEYKSSEALCSFMEQQGFQAERNFKDMETAFCVSAEVGSGGPSLLFLSEYDALPELGHACGHNLIAVSGAAVFLSALRYAEKYQIPGKFTLIGTPAEEAYGGKVTLQERGAFDGFDAAFLMHPFAGTATDPGWLSTVQINVSFQGKPSHAASRPEDGLNALDAAVQLYNSVAMWRQQLPERARIHGIFLKGGDAHNIIPEYTEMFWNLRATDWNNTRKMVGRFEKMVQGAAECTETVGNMKILTSYAPSVFNAPLNRIYGDLWHEMFGETIKRGDGTEGRASSDFGNISLRIPSANYLFDITQGADHPLHTAAFRDDAASDYAFENTMRASAVTAAAAIRFLLDPGFRKEVQDDWKNRIR